MTSSNARSACERRGRGHHHQQRQRLRPAGQPPRGPPRFGRGGDQRLGPDDVEEKWEFGRPDHRPLGADGTPRTTSRRPGWVQRRRPSSFGSMAADAVIANASDIGGKTERVARRRRTSRSRTPWSRRCDAAGLRSRRYCCQDAGLKALETRFAEYRFRRYLAMAEHLGADAASSVKVDRSSTGQSWTRLLSSSWSRPPVGRALCVHGDGLPWSARGQAGRHELRVVGPAVYVPIAHVDGPNCVEPSMRSRRCSRTRSRGLGQNLSTTSRSCDPTA